MSKFDDKLEKIVDTMLEEQIVVNKIGQKPYDKAVAAIKTLIRHELIGLNAPEYYIFWHGYYSPEHFINMEKERIRKALDDE